MTARDLEAELRQVIRDSHNPAMLRELFAALNSNPRLLAEALARPVLVSRVARNRYAMDDRFHGATERDARGALALVTDSSQCLRLSRSERERV